MSTPDSFDRQFRRTARSMRRAPSTRQWDRIEQRLNDRQRGTAGSLRLGLRPWMVAAVVLLVAGVAAFIRLPASTATAVLEQRPESVEDLAMTETTYLRIPDYRPVSEGPIDGALVSRAEWRRGQLAPAPKYRF